MSDLLRKVAAHIRHLQAERHRNGRAGWKNKKEEEVHIYRQGDTRQDDGKGGCWKETGGRSINPQKEIRYDRK